MNKEQTKDPVLTVQAAMQALREGKVLHLVDDGKGFVLPGVLIAMPGDIAVQVLQHMAVPEGDKIVQMELCIANIAPVGQGQHIVRFYSPRDFAGNSLWIADEDTAAVMDPADSVKEALMESEGVDEAEAEQLSKIIPFVPKGGLPN